MDTLHNANFSKITRKKIVEILDIVIYKLELRLQTGDEIGFLDLPHIYPGVEGVDSRDASSVFKLLADMFRKDGFSFPVQGIKPENEGVSWKTLLENLKNLKENLHAPVGSSPAKDGMIRKITVITPTNEGSLYKIVINDLTDAIFEADRIKLSWSLFYDVMTGTEVCDSKNRYKANMHYLNTNINCKLYTRTNLAPTRILKKENNRIKAAVATEVVSEILFACRRTKADKKEEKG